MKSGADSEPLDLGRLVTTSADVSALRAVRALPMRTEDYLRALARLAPPPDALRRRKGPSGTEPFRL
jgi:hypothetical protein